MNEPQVLRAALTDGEIHGLVRAAGIEPGLLSPLQDLADPGGDVTATARAALIDSGWLRQQPPGLTDAGRAAVTCLARPQTRLTILLGTGDWIGHSIALAAGDLSTAEPLLSVARGEGEWYLVYPQPQTEPVALLHDHFDLAVIPTAERFEVTLTVAEYAALMCLLDHRLETTLQATLDRDYAADDALSIAAASALLREGRTSSNLNWQVTVSAALHDDIDLDVDESTLASAFAELERRGLTTRLEDGRYHPNADLMALQDSLVPVARFAAVGADRLTAPGTVESTRVVVRHGPTAILFEEVLADGRVLMRSVTSLELADLLLNVRFTRGVRPPAPRFCGRCGAAVQPTDRTCTACGAAADPADEVVR